jgi:hypothetical protein
MVLFAGAAAYYAIATESFKQKAARPVNGKFFAKFLS